MGVPKRTQHEMHSVPAVTPRGNVAAAAVAAAAAAAVTCH